MLNIRRFFSKTIDTPFDILHYFKHKNEKVLSCTHSKHGYYEVKTDQESYFCEIRNGIVSVFVDDSQKT